MNVKRITYVRGIICSIVLVLLYLSFVFPTMYFVHGQGVFISSQIREQNNSIYVNHKLYGLVDINTPASKCAYVGGFPIAVALYTDGVIVDDISHVETAFGKTTPASQITKGDFLTELNGEKISCVTDIDEVLSRINIDANIGWKFQPQKRQKRRINKSSTTAIVDEMLLNYETSDISTQKNDNIVENQLNNERNSEKVGEIDAVILRNNVKKTIKIRPALEEFSNKYRLGIVVRDYILGVGTVSFIKEDGSFGALGHPISDSVAGRVPIRGGLAFKCKESGVVKGERGSPGELRVKIGSMKSPIGTISRNTDCGIFGKFNSVNEILESKCYATNSILDADDGGKLHSVSARKQVAMGNAYICTSIDGNVDYYKIEIVRAINQSGFGDKGLVVRVVDKRLIEKTGGIIQGMSGSPIIQNNKIIGAITHVFVNEPCKGFGIYIDFMYDN